MNNNTVLSYHQYFKNILQKVYLYAISIIVIGNIADAIFNYDFFGTVVYLNLLVAILNLVGFILYINKKVNLQFIFGFSLYVVFINIIISIFIFQDMEYELTVILLRKTIFVLVIVAGLSLFLNRTHGLILSIIWVIIYLYFTIQSNNKFLLSYSPTIIFTFITFSIVNSFFLKVFSNSLTALQQQKQEIQNQHNLLNQTSEIIINQNKELSNLTEKLNIKSTELEIKNEELEKALKTKDKFISILAHDLKNPINTILGFSELLRKKISILDIGKQKIYLDSIISSTQTTNSLIENLLYWSRAQMGSIKPILQLYFVNEPLQKALSYIHASARQKNIEISHTIPSNLMAFFDVMITETIFRNILSNAVKYSYENERISISYTIENNMLKIYIADNGCGMSIEQTEQLFLLKENKSVKGTKGEQGSGLGLIICKEFAEIQGGQLFIESSSGKGSTISFSIRLNPNL